MLLLWGIQLSFVSVGQTWFAFGWEIQLLETGMLGVFLCPLLDGRPFPATRTPLVVIGLFRWLLFRMMLGAGLIESDWRLAAGALAATGLALALSLLSPRLRAALLPASPG